MTTVKEYKLVKYRDAGMQTYTYFWINEKERIVSPYFSDCDTAENWLRNNSSDAA